MWDAFTTHLQHLCAHEHGSAPSTSRSPSRLAPTCTPHLLNTHVTFPPPLHVCTVLLVLLYPLLRRQATSVAAPPAADMAASSHPPMKPRWLHPPPLHTVIAHVAVDIAQHGPSI